MPVWYKPEDQPVAYQARDSFSTNMHRSLADAFPFSIATEYLEVTVAASGKLLTSEIPAKVAKCWYTVSTVYSRTLMNPNQAAMLSYDLLVVPLYFRPFLRGPINHP